MRKINLIDILIIIILIFSIYSFAIKETDVYQQVDEYYYSGSQIYKATNYMNFLDSKGFQYDTWVRGYWWSDYLSFEETGYVLDAGQGSFTFLRENGEIVTIGGRMSYKEQIGASEIRLIIKTKSTVHYRMYSSTYENFSEFIKSINETASFLDGFVIDDIAITGEITFDRSTTPSEVFDEEVTSTLRAGLYYVKNVDIESTKNGMTIKFTQASINELENIGDLLATHEIAMEKIFSSDLYVIVRTGKEIGELDKYWIKEHIAKNLSDIVDPETNSIHIRL